jgi:putative endonuclease
MADNRRHVLGKYGETVAAEFLTRQGYEIIERNWHCRSGEIDLIAREDDSWVFIEVKTRNSASSIEGLFAVDEVKLQKLRKSIAEWCSSRQIRSNKLRLDVVSVFLNAGLVRFEHLKQVF